MAVVNIGSWNIQRSGLSGGRGGKIAQFILDWLGVTVPTTTSASTWSPSPFGLSGGQTGGTKVQGFVFGGTLVSQSSFPDSSSTKDIGRYTGVSAESKLESHGIPMSGNTVDVVFLQEVKGELNETLKLVAQHGGGQVDVHHPESVIGECGLAAVWKKNVANGWRVAEAAYRDLVAITVKGTNVLCFGGHAKSGGGHDTQLDVGKMLIAAQREVVRAGQSSFIAVVVGDMNTEPVFASDGGTAVRHMKVSTQGGDCTWQAVSPGIATHDDNTLDFAWVAFQGAPPFTFNPYHPANVGTHRLALRQLSDHVPVGFSLDIPKLTVL